MNIYLLELPQVEDHPNWALRMTPVDLQKRAIITPLCVPFTSQESAYEALEGFGGRLFDYTALEFSPNNEWEVIPCGKPAVESGPHGAWCVDHWGCDLKTGKPLTAADLAAAVAKAEPGFETIEVYGLPLYWSDYCDANKLFVVSGTTIDWKVRLRRDSPPTPENTVPYGPPDPGPIARELADIIDRARVAKAYLVEFVRSSEQERRVIARFLPPVPEPDKRNWQERHPWLARAAGAAIGLGAGLGALALGQALAAYVL